MKQKIIALIAVVLISAFPLLAHAQEDINASFNPDKLIDDAVFADTKTFGGPEGIQKFLESKNSPLANTTPAFVALLKEPNINILKQTLEDKNPNLGRSRTAAELVWDAAQSAGINPQVILVTLNKEQSLITGRQNSTPEQMQRALDFSLGFGCPHSAACGDIYRGFYFQLFGNVDSENNRYLGAAGSLVKSFTTPGGRGPAVNGSPAKVGNVITLDNTLGGYNNVQPQQTITISNNATAALYRYTPHVFNGNYNFWKFFNSWFRYANGTLVKGSDGIVYVIQNGSKLTIAPFIAQARGLNLSTAIAASQTELDAYPIGTPYGPANNTIISVDGKLYVFIDNIKHPASNFVITQRGLNPANAVVVAAADVSTFQDGTQLTPTDGTVLRGNSNPAIYLVEGGTLKLFLPYTFSQQQAAKKVQLIADADLESYPKKGYVAPLSGSLVKANSSQTVYVVEGSAKRPLTGELFRNLGYKFTDIAVLPDELVDSLGIGAFATPKDGSYYQSSGQLYWFKEGSQHAISKFVAQQKKITPDFTFGVDEVKSWPLGTPVAPRDNTAIKGDNSAAVYLVQSGQLRILTFAAFQARKIVPKNIVVVAQAELDGYAKGDVLTK